MMKFDLQDAKTAHNNNQLHCQPARLPKQTETVLTPLLSVNFEVADSNATGLAIFMSHGGGQCFVSWYVLLDRFMPLLHKICHATVCEGMTYFKIIQN